MQTVCTRLFFLHHESLRMRLRHTVPSVPKMTPAHCFLLMLDEIKWSSKVGWGVQAVVRSSTILRVTAHYVLTLHYLHPKVTISITYLGYAGFFVLLDLNCCKITHCVYAYTWKRITVRYSITHTNTLTFIATLECNFISLHKNRFCFGANVRHLKCPQKTSNL